MKTDPSARTAPANAEPNNQDVFIWALFLLGGADRDVDVEEVFLKSFELAPARLGWRTHPEIPEYKKTSKALQSVEASTHVGLVHRVGPYSRRLTADGVRWVERNNALLRANYGGHAPVRAPVNNAYERRRRTLKSGGQFVAWKGGQDFDIFDLADAFECMAASPANVWRGRVEEARRTADVVQDTELAAFVEAVDEFLKKRNEVA